MITGKSNNWKKPLWTEDDVKSLMTGEWLSVEPSGKITPT